MYNSANKNRFAGQEEPEFFRDQTSQAQDKENQGSTTKLRVKQNNFQSGVQTELANSNLLQKKFILEPVKENTGKKKISVLKHIRNHKSSNKSINSFGSNANRLISNIA